MNATPKERTRMRNTGFGLLALGAAIMLFGLLKSGAAEYSDTLNIGLLNDKTNLVMFGGFTSVVGAIFASVGQFRSELGRTEVINDEVEK